MRVTILPRVDALRAAAQQNPRFDAILSIDDPAEDMKSQTLRYRDLEHFRAFCPHVVSLNFKDTDNMFELDGPWKSDITAIVQFAADLPDNANVLVHCKAGRCRSPTSVVIMLMSQAMTRACAVDIVEGLCPNFVLNGPMMTLFEQEFVK
jgi:predicted protein tyrosine phosphatase